MRRHRAICGELLAPLSSRREVVDGVLPTNHFRRFRRSGQPTGQSRAPAWRRCGANPLKERRTSKDIQVLRVGVILERDAGWWISPGEGVPVAIQPGNCPLVDGAQRLTARNPFLDPRVTHDERAEGDEQRRPRCERQGDAVDNSPDQQGEPWKKGNETPARQCSGCLLGTDARRRVSVHTFNVGGPDGVVGGRFSDA